MHDLIYSVNMQPFIVVPSCIILLLILLCIVQVQTSCLFSFCHLYIPLCLSSFFQGGDPSQERNYSLEVISFKGFLFSELKFNIALCGFFLLLFFFLPFHYFHS